jgi:tellurite methyltransferase
MSGERPFWEAMYADLEAETFGPASEEVLEIATRLSENALVLDVGCGDGRNAVCLAEHGLNVDAFDVSPSGIRKCRKRAAAQGVSVRTWVQDVGTFVFRREYDLVVAHGVLHLLERGVWTRLLKSIQRHTRVDGWNIVAVFTERLSPPPDLAPFMRGLFREGELLELYDGWFVEGWEAYTLEDEHPGGVHHEHPLNMIVAQRPRE